jgi:tRNA-binding protein
VQSFLQSRGRLRPARQEKWSSAQITSYSESDLIGRLIACVVNMPSRNIAGFQSQVLILGAKNARSEVIPLSPLAEIALGEPMF